MAIQSSVCIVLLNLTSQCKYRSYPRLLAYYSDSGVINLKLYVSVKFGDILYVYLLTVYCISVDNSSKFRL